MILRSAFAFGVLAAGFAASGAAQAYSYPPPYYPPENTQAYPPSAYSRGPVGNGQPESFGAAPQPGYAPNQAAVPLPYSPYGAPAAQEQGPMQLAPGARPPADVAGRDATGTVRPSTVAMLPPEDQPETGKAELPPQFK